MDPHASRRSTRLGSLGTLACLCLPYCAGAQDLFTSQIEPLLKKRCYECHSHEGAIKGGLALDSKSGWQQGGDSGPALIPGKPEASLLMKALSHAEKDLKMPPKKRLSAAEIALLTDWVRLGAVDPRVSPIKASQGLVVADSWEVEFQKRLDWWSLKPLKPGGPPAVDDSGWATQPVDRFVLASLEAAKLPPAPPADPEVLARRVSLVLTGLPPRPRESDSSYESLVEELLGSPHFGEHFARHWMDVIRYTDTYGYEWDNPAKGAYEYRDYLIRAYNEDTGFDQFLREQLAGDLLPQPRLHAVFQTNESLIGPMFYHLGEHRHGSSLMFNGIHQEMVNNKIDAFSKAFLATTVACARCHDHKLEAVSQQDYFALAAVFTTPRWTSRVVDAPGKNDVAIARLTTLRGAIREALANQWRGPGNTLSPATLMDWALKNRSTLQKAPPGGVGEPLRRLLDGTTPTPPGKPVLSVAEIWIELASEWRTARQAAQKTNADFSPLGDVAGGVLPKGWVCEGDGMAHGHVTEATPLIALEGNDAVAHFLPAGFHTHALSSKLPGAIRTPPEHRIPGKMVSLNLAGGEFGGTLVVDDHAFQNETISFFKNTVPAWKSFVDAQLIHGVQQVTVEVATSALNPNFPPRTGLAAGLPSKDFGDDKRSWFSLTGIVTHEKAGTPQEERNAFAPLYEGAPPTTATEAWTRLSCWLGAAVERWSDNKSRPGDSDLMNWLLENRRLPQSILPGSRLAALVDEYRRTEASISFPRTVNSMDEREVEKAAYPINVRGSVDAPGKLMAPGFLRLFPDHGQVSESSGSGRLELANLLLDPQNPLTARVYVNRVWQWVFGTGLVATPDDFGRLGARPSHPELLDWLALEFIREGWSTKTLLRHLVLSNTFRQSGLVSEVARRLDPSNRLLHHYPTRRLEAESIRDSLLAVSGCLDPTLYGRPILPPRSVEDPAKRLFSGPLDGAGRRSLYLQMSIMDPPRFLVGFNLPDLKLPSGKRDATNVPAQALALLNDPFVHAMAGQWAVRLVQDKGSAPADRLRGMFRSALGRDPDDGELQSWTAAAHSFATQNDLLSDEAAWGAVAHTLFNTKEFIYFR